MSGGGGKGGSQSTQVRLPDFIEEAGERAVARGEDIAKIGFVPHMGPDVAAFSPTQEAAFAGTNMAASAFGLPQSQGTGLPEAQDFGGGIRGFSSFPIFEQSLQDLREARPGQVAAIEDFFIDPVTGRMAGRGATGGGGGNRANRVRHAGGDRESGSSFGGGGGFTGFRDMFDGGGAGASGDRFQGGGILSDIANARSDRRDREEQSGGGGGLLGRLF